MSDAARLIPTIVPHHEREWRQVEAVIREATGRKVMNVCPVCHKYSILVTPVADEDAEPIIIERLCWGCLS